MDFSNYDFNFNNYENANKNEAPFDLSSLRETLDSESVAVASTHTMGIQWATCRRKSVPRRRGSENLENIDSDCDAASYVDEISRAWRYIQREIQRVRAHFAKKRSVGSLVDPIMSRKRKRRATIRRMLKKNNVGLKKRNCVKILKF
jgi:hypothetical protein